MHHFTLIPHPDHPPRNIAGVTVSLSITDGNDILLEYRVTGGARIMLPDWRAPDRTDELWRTTCFELFLMLHDDERYVEFNFSPSTQWAAYAFEKYREGMTNLLRDVPPFIERTESGVDVDLDLGGLPHGELRMALTAVIEEEGGARSYWSLAHPPGAPDFHHAACFVARLPAPGRA